MLTQRRAPLPGVADLRVDTSSTRITANKKPLQQCPSADDDTALTTEDDVSPPPAAPIEHMSARGIFLLVMAFLVFAAFVLFVLSEMTHHHQHHHGQNDGQEQERGSLLLLFTAETQRDVHSASLWVLVLAVPITSVATWFPVSITHASDGVFRIRSPITRISSLSPTAARIKSLPLVQRLVYRFRTNFYFRAYQSAAWVLYGVFLAMVLGCSSPFQSLPLPHTLMNLKLPFCDFGHRSNVAVVAFIAQVLMISSVLALERRRDHDRSQQRSSKDAAALPRRTDRFVLILNNFNNTLLLVGAVVLAVASEYTRHANEGESDAYSLTSGLGSLALFVTAMLNTYGLGGLLSSKRGWRFYQPFMGGARFVLFQVISWTCFGAGLLIQGLYLLSIVLVEMELFVGVMALAGALFVISQVVMMMSVLVFRSPSSSLRATATPSTTTTKDGESATLSSVAATAPQGFHGRLQAFADECLGALLIGMLVNLQWIPSASFFLIYAATTNLDASGVIFYGCVTIFAEIFFVLSRSITIHMYSKDSDSGKNKSVSTMKFKYHFLPLTSLALPGYATYYHFVHDLDALLPVAFLSGFMYLYAFTYRGDPQHSGVRMNRVWVTSRSKLTEAVVTYFRGKIIRVTPLNPQDHYVMAFHPHGIMPTTAMWLLFTEQWRQLFPGVHPCLLTASVLHQIPLSRDVMQTYGSREVTRQAFTSTLEQKQSVMLVPGGQAEMLEQHSGRKEVRVYTKHKGFIRVAIEHGTPLVPVLSFKEGELMDNVKAPMLQRWFVKNLAFPFPYFPYGRGFLPIPRKVDTTVVVGAPIRVQKIASPTADDVDKVHVQYFAALEEMFHKYKDEANCADYKLVLI